MEVGKGEWGDGQWKKSKFLVVQSVCHSNKKFWSIHEKRGGPDEEEVERCER